MNKDKKNKNQVLKLILIITFLINTINFGIYMYDAITTSIQPAEWSEVRYRNEQEKRKAQEAKAKERGLERNISLICFEVSILILLIDLSNQEKRKVYYVLTVLIVIETIFMML